MIEQYLKRQKENGEPMRVHFLDTNHKASEPTQIFADKSLHDLAKKYGVPLYVIEAIDAKFTDSIVPHSMDDHKRKSAFNKYINATPKNIEKPARLKSLEQIILYKMYDDFTSSDLPTNIALPDPREKELKNQLTKQELALYRKDEEFLSRIIKELENNRENAGFNKETFMQNAQNEHNKLFSEEENRVLQIAKKKAYIVYFGGDDLDTSKMDEKISDSINAAFNPNRDVQITLYGVGHFTKQHDLNEQMEGINIAIMGSNKTEWIKILRELFLSEKYRHIHNQFPEYVYYANEKRLVKMDNNEAKAEFLGMTLDEFNEYKAKRQIDNNIQLKNFDMAKAETIPTASQVNLPMAKNKPQQPNLYA